MKPKTNKELLLLLNDRQERFEKAVIEVLKKHDLKIDKLEDISKGNQTSVKLLIWAIPVCVTLASVLVKYVA